MVSTLMTQSPSKLLVSGHMSLWSNSLDINSNKAPKILMCIPFLKIHLVYLQELLKSEYFQHYLEVQLQSLF